eukprot:2131553-Rhodomonas_salina.2
MEEPAGRGHHLQRHFASVPSVARARETPIGVRARRVRVAVVRHPALVHVRAHSLRVLGIPGGAQALGDARGRGRGVCGARHALRGAGCVLVAAGRARLA